MLTRTLFGLLVIGSAAYAAPAPVAPAFEVQAKVDKRNAQLNFGEGAVVATIDKRHLDSIMGMTGDFGPRRVPTVIVFDQSVTEERLVELADHQGRLNGSVQCKRVRFGSSPQFPHWKSAVLAEQCSITNLNH